MTDRCSLRSSAQSESFEPLLEKIAAAAEAGIDWIQIREKDLCGKDCAVLTGEALRRVANLLLTTGAIRTRILVNDRLDIALAEHAGGVHLGEHSLPVAEAKRLVKLYEGSRGFLCGVSGHSLEATNSAAADGADYVFFGPVFPTPSKVAYGPPQGLERLAQVSRAVSVPVLAIGGITLENAAACLAAGASGLAAIRLFQDAEDLPRLLRALRSIDV